MIALACGLLALGVVSFLITPLLDQQRRVSGAKTEVEDLLKKKEFLYAAIRELNIDFNMGKLSAEDHRQLQAEYMQEAAALLDRLERVNGKQNVGARVEQEVLALRQRRLSVRPAKPDSQPAAVVPSPPSDPSSPPDVSEPASQAEVLTCQQCGTVNAADAKFCVECGAELDQFLCAGCGKPYKPGSKFCSQCGQRL